MLLIITSIIIMFTVVFLLNMGTGRLKRNWECEQEDEEQEKYLSEWKRNNEKGIKQE